MKIILCGLLSPHRLLFKTYDRGGDDPILFLPSKKIFLEDWYTLWIYLMPLNNELKNGLGENVTLSIFHQNKIFWKAIFMENFKSE